MVEIEYKENCGEEDLEKLLENYEIDGEGKVIAEKYSVPSVPPFHYSLVSIKPSPGSKITSLERPESESSFLSFMSGPYLDLRVDNERLIRFRECWYKVEIE